MSGSTTSTASVRSTAAGPCCASRSTPSTVPSTRPRRPGGCGDHDASGGLHGRRRRQGRRRRRSGSERAPADRRPSVGYRLGRSIAGWRHRCRTPSIFGRVAIAQTMRDVAPDLMDILGSASALPIGTDGAADDGAAEYVYRFAPLVGIYGGTLEVFRNMIAQHASDWASPTTRRRRRPLDPPGGALRYRQHRRGRAAGDFGAPRSRVDRTRRQHARQSPDCSAPSRYPAIGPATYGRADGSA